MGSTQTLNSKALGTLSHFNTPPGIIGHLSPQARHNDGLFCKMSGSECEQQSREALLGRSGGMLPLKTIAV